MDIGGSSHRAEAERWLTAAEKLLATRDFHGTKSFAYRARECDPRLEATDRIISVVDTLLAGERLINNHPDWYAILQLSHLTQGVDVIAEHYRRLALLLNPELNRFPYADQAFRLVSEAWTVLSNPSKKAFYDNEVRMIQFGSHLGGFQQQQPPKKTTPPPPRNNKEPTPAVEEEIRPHQQQPQSQLNDGSFWTACPYCYVLYEHAKAYEDCALKCQVCERSFQAVAVPPPPVTEKDTFYSCWAYFPLAFSGSDDKGPDGGSGWKPFSPMFQTPNAAQSNKKGGGGQRRVNAATAPRVYYDDEDIYVEVSDTSDDSDDDDWNNSSEKRTKKRGRPPKDRSPPGSSKGGGSSATMKPPATDNDHDPPVNSRGGVENNNNNNNNNSTMQGQGGSEQQSRKLGGAGNHYPVRKQAGRGAKALGKLDLNVEFSNEVEESSRAAATASRGHGRVHGVEDNIEGTGFFEGLDEFLNSLPILSAVDDKVKAA